MDDFLSKAKSLLEDVAGQAGRQAEIVRLQTKLGSLDDSRDQQYIEAGKRARELLTMRQIHDEELRIILERIKEIEEEMMNLRAKVAKLQGGDEDGDDMGPDSAKAAGPEG